MKRVLTAVILIPIVVIALFRAPLWLFALLVLGVALLAAKEYFDIAEATGYRPMRGLGYLFLLMTFVVVWGIADVSDAEGARNNLTPFFFFYSVPAIVLVAPLLFMLDSMRRLTLSQALPDAAVSYMVLPYVGFTLALLPMMRTSPSGPVYLLFLMLLVWSGDIAAYYVGRAIGKHKLAPRISPGKTWEGAIASTIGSVIVAALLFHESSAIVSGLARIGLLQKPFQLFGPETGIDARPLVSFPFVYSLVFPILVNISAQLGDLFESAIKRGAGLKDSGTLLPGHGGVLDRIDALLFALPVGFFFFTMR